MAHELVLFPMQVPNKTRACSSYVKAAIRALLVTEEEPPKSDSLYHCWLCNEGPKQSKAKPEEFLYHLKAKHQDHELIPDILRYQQIHLLVILKPVILWLSDLLRFPTFIFC